MKTNFLFPPPPSQPLPLGDRQWRPQRRRLFLRALALRRRCVDPSLCRSVGDAFPFSFRPKSAPRSPNQTDGGRRSRIRQRQRHSLARSPPLSHTAQLRRPAVLFDQSVSLSFLFRPLLLRLIPTEMQIKKSSFIGNLTRGASSRSFFFLC